MSQTALNPAPGTSVFDDRGVGTIAGVDKNQRKTGYRADAVMSGTDNSNDPEKLIRTVTDPRLA